MKYDECPIHKATRKTNIVSGNECQSCAFYNNCLADMSRDMDEEILAVFGKYIQEMKDAIIEYIIKERKEMEKKKCL